MTAPHQSAHESAQQAFTEGHFEAAAKAFASTVGECRGFLTQRGLAFDRDDTRIDLETCEARTLFLLARYEEARTLQEACLVRSLVLHGEDHVLTEEARVVLGSVFVRGGRMELATDEFLAAHAAIERGTAVPEGTPVRASRREVYVASRGARC